MWGSEQDNVSGMEKWGKQPMDKWGRQGCYGHYEKLGGAASKQEVNQAPTSKSLWAQA